MKEVRSKINPDAGALTIVANMPEGGTHTDTQTHRYTDTRAYKLSSLFHILSLATVCTFLILMGGTFLFIRQRGWKLTCSKHTTMGFPPLWSLYVLYA